MTASELEPARGLVERRLCVPKLWTVLVALCGTEFNVEPEDFIAAIGELLFGTICLSVVVTVVFHRDILDDNPVRNMLGYNNPCVFWDEPPALYLASALFAPMIYLAVRYAHLDTARASLSPNVKRYERVCRIINWVYACSQLVFMGVFVIRPDFHEEHSLSEKHWLMRAHSACFLQLVLVLCVTIVANFVEGYLSGRPAGRPSAKSWAVVILYVVASAMEFTLLTYAIFTYEGDYSKDGRDSNFRLNPWLLMVVDYAWFLSLPIVGFMQPPAPNLRFHYELEPDYDEVPAQIVGWPATDAGLPADSR